MSIPRGIRNNNPGNIEYNERNNWKGQIGTDGRFVIFESPEMGIRAIARIFSNYQKRGKNTMRKIVETWAPSHENDTEAYVHSVYLRSGLLPDDILTAEDWPELIDAIIQHENGQQPYSMQLIERGIALA